MFVRAQINIEAPAARIFRLLDDPQSRKKWFAGLVDTRETGGRPGEAGSTFVERVDMGGTVREYQCTVLAKEYPRRLTIRQQSEGMSVTNDWVLQPSGSGTQLVCGATMTTNRRILRLLSIFSRSMVKRILIRQCRRLKMLAETR